MKNPLGKMALVATPDNMKQLEKHLEQFSGSERVVATVSAFMAWNLACKLIDEAIEEENKGDK